MAIDLTLPRDLHTEYLMERYGYTITATDQNGATDLKFTSIIGASVFARELGLGSRMIIREPVTDFFTALTVTVTVAPAYVRSPELMARIAKLSE
jgi:hypothetical protein